MLFHSLVMRRASLFQEQSREGSRDIAAIPKQPASQTFDHLRNGLTIIDIARSQTTSQQIAAVLDCRMQLEAVKSSHTCLDAISIGGKDAMLADALRMTDFQRRRVNEADARTSSATAL